MMSPRARLAVAAALFVGWLGWLSYAALSKSRGPVVSRAQAAALAGDAKGVAVVAEVSAGDEGKPAAKAKVVKSLTAGGPAAGTEIDVLTLPEAAGYDVPGQYLLLLTPERGGDLYSVARLPASPGYESLSGAGKPTIYRWSPEVEAQAAKLFP